MSQHGGSGSRLRVVRRPLVLAVARTALLWRVTDCPDSTCAADLLRDNPYQRVDGLVLRANGDRLVMPTARMTGRTGPSGRR